MGHSLRNVPRPACGAGGDTAGAPRKLLISYLRNIYNPLYMWEMVSLPVGRVNSAFVIERASSGVGLFPL